MGWTNPKTWLAGAPLPATELNQHVRDQFVFLHDKGGDLASAAALPTPTTQFHAVTGTTTITSVPILAAGTRLVLWFTSACQVTSGNNLVLRGNFVAAAGDVLELISDGVNWHEITRSNAGKIDYAQITANVTLVGTTEAAATTVVSGNSVNYDGNPVRVDFWAPGVNINSAITATFVLLRDATVIGQFAPTLNSWAGAADMGEVAMTVYETPPAGAHQYVVKAFASGASGAIVYAGTGGPGAKPQAFLRVERG